MTWAKSKGSKQSCAKDANHQLKEVNRMKLVSADFHEKDVRTIEGLVEKLKEKDPSITLKKYVRLCVVQYTDAILNAMTKEIEDAKLQREKESSERAGGVDSGDHQTEGRSSQDSNS